MLNKGPLFERFEKIAANLKFSAMELLGFKENPFLAILAGMAIGYKMALDDLMEWHKETQKGPGPDDTIN